MHLKDKIKKRLLALEILDRKIIEKQKNFLNNKEVGKVLIDGLFPFGLIMIKNNDYIISKELKTETATIKINVLNWIKI